MRRFTAFFLALTVAFTLVANVSAQSNDSIWLTASTNSFKTGETVKVTLNAAATTPIQGFTFQVRYDPACLQPVNASSPISGMNGLPLPQLTGLVDGSYASTTPLTVNGVLAEIRFTALGACQTNLTLESAALAIRTAEGFAAPLAGVTIGEKNVALMVSAEKVEAQAVQPETGSTLSLEPPAQRSGISGWVVGLVILLVFGGIGMAAWQFLRSTKTDTPAKQRTPKSTAAVLHMKMGPQAGKSITLNKLPVLIGRDPQNDICLNDPHVIGQHARIFANNNTFYLMDLGGETVINGKSIQKSSVILKPGDVIRLGKRSLFVFG